MAKNSTPVESDLTRPPDLRNGARIVLTVTDRISGTVTAIQYAGCTHAITKRVGLETVHTTTHGAAPCPDRDQPIGLMIRAEGTNRRQWVYLSGVPGRRVEIRAEARR